MLQSMGSQRVGHDLVNEQQEDQDRGHLSEGKETCWRQMSYSILSAISGSCQNVVCAWISPCRDSGSLQTLSETLLVGMEIVLKIERISKETANDKISLFIAKKRSTLIPVCRALRDERKRAAQENPRCVVGGQRQRTEWTRQGLVWPGVKRRPYLITKDMIK